MSTNLENLTEEMKKMSDEELDKVLTACICKGKKTLIDKIKKEISHRNVKKELLECGLDKEFLKI